jgi:hypothetical protein
VISLFLVCLDVNTISSTKQFLKKQTSQQRARKNIAHRFKNARCQHERNRDTLSQADTHQWMNVLKKMKMTLEQKNMEITRLRTEVQRLSLTGDHTNLSAGALTQSYDDISQQSDDNEDDANSRLTPTDKCIIADKEIESHGSTSRQILTSNPRVSRPHLEVEETQSSPTIASKGHLSKQTPERLGADYAEMNGNELRTEEPTLTGKLTVHH